MGFEDLIADYDILDRKPSIDFTGSYDSYKSVAVDTPVELNKISKTALQIMYYRVVERSEQSELSKSLKEFVNKFNITACGARAKLEQNGDATAELCWGKIFISVPLSTAEMNNLKEALKGSGREEREKELSFKSKGDDSEMEI